MLETRDLRLVQAVAEHGSVTRAARALALSQSALSRRLLDLEGDLGRPLFERRPRAMVPTAAGRELLAAAGGLLGELAAVEARVRAHDGAPPPLRLATECYTCYRWLPAALARLAPPSRVVIVVAATRDPVAALLRDELDVALVSAPRRDRRLVVAPAFIDELVLVTARDHPLARRRRPVDAAELAGETLFTYDAPLDETLLARRVLAPAGVRPRAVHPVPFTEAIVELCAAGLGVAALARWAVAPLVAEGRVAATRITARGLVRHWYGARRRGGHPDAEAFLALATSALAPPRRSSAPPRARSPATSAAPAAPPRAPRRRRSSGSAAP
jgi:LysR family transcriptional regulator for metE and metH